MAVERSSQDRVGEVVEVTLHQYRDRKFKIIGDDSHSRPMKKLWDYLLQDVETGELIRVLSEKIKDSSELPTQ